MRKKTTIGTDCHWKNMERWVDPKNLALYNVYNVPTLFQKHGTHYGPWSGFQYCKPPIEKTSTIPYLLNSSGCTIHFTGENNS